MVKSNKPKTKLSPKPKTEKKKSKAKAQAVVKVPKSAKPSKSAEPSKSAKLSKPVKPSKSAKPSKPVKPKQAENSKIKEKTDKDFIKKPGQKFPEPSIDDPSRAFYESLYSQKPESQMAEKWCLEHGLLPEEDSKKLSEKYKRKK